MIQREDQQIHMIPVDQIRVLNPRSRGKVKFKQIVDNIGRLGLKKPVSVSRIGEQEYLLVCGQGRLEAFSRLTTATENGQHARASPELRHRSPPARFLIA